MSRWRVFVGVSTLLQVFLVSQVYGDCEPLNNCNLASVCPYGLDTDSNNCTICACLDLCKNYDCGLYEVCEVRVPYCTDQNPCPPRPTCVPRPASSGGMSTDFPTTLLIPGTNICLQPPTRGGCDLVSTRWFFNVTAIKCQSFQYGGCGGNPNNFQTEAECLARCLRTSLPCPVTDSCTSPCQLQWDNKGCQMCVCPGASCNNYTCAVNEKCSMVDGQCVASDEVCYSRPQCQAAAETTVMMSTSRCPYLECELLKCDHGVKKDQYDCPTCLCYDPCENYTCPAGQRCALTANSCPPGTTDCRDAPMRYCTDETPPPVVRNKPSAEELMSCCISGGMSTNCQPLCMLNLTVSSSNTATLLQCANELKTYLKCAAGLSGDESFMDCCTKKSVGFSCYEFCAGNASLDSTNPHTFTECIMLADFNDVINCYVEGTPDVRTSSAVVSSPMSTPRPGVEMCTQAPDPGPCDAAITRWYFNPNTVQCEEFTYGGCEGNVNNFQSLDTCVALCMRTVATPPPAGCPEPLCDLGCTPQPGPTGCNICVCPSAGMSSTLPSTTQPLPVSLQDCCYEAGVSDMCMPFCSFDFNFDTSHFLRLMECEPYLSIGLQCAKGGKTYTRCCNATGVTGQCLDACGTSVHMTNLSCLVDYHQDMMNCFSNQQSDDQCPRTDSCPGCTYGYVKDSMGCKTCACADPCKDVQCTNGRVCTYKQYPSTCVGDVCEVEYRGECTASCPELLDCAACEFGNVKDKNGCNTCVCSDPCMNVTCADSEQCVPRIVPTNVNGQVKEEFIGECRRQCNDEATLAVCFTQCKYGFMKDENKCIMCKCHEPCANITCDGDKTCKVVPTTEADNSDYTLKGVCRDPCMPPPCNKYCKYGYAKDSNGCESSTCECYDPCMDKKCDNVYICMPRRITDQPPVEYIGECVQCSGMLCDIQCNYGTLMLTPACPLCQCYDPCQNTTCGPQETCTPKPRNSTIDNPQSYTAECVPTRVCPAPMCSNQCQYGYMKTAEGCDSCDCYDPCMTVRCMTGLECEVRTDTGCLTGNCSQVAFATCVPPKAPCMVAAMTRGSVVDDSSSALSDTSSLLNCDMTGLYKPLQCDVTGSCMCTTPLGMNEVQGLSLVQAVDKCYPKDKIVGLLRIQADFSIIRPSEGVIFKRNISKQLGDVVGLPDTNVTVTEYRAGSIMVDFVLASDNKALMDLALNTLETYAMRDQLIPLEYDGEHYHASLESFVKMPLPSTTFEPPTTRKHGLTRAELLAVVIIVPIGACIIIALIVALCLCKFIRKEKPLISDSVRSSMSFDSVLAEKGEHINKSGYENPSYDNAKIRPVSASFSTTSTSA